MKYLKDNKLLILKYLFIFISNILIYYFSSFYLKSINNKEIIMFFIIFIMDYIIYFYKSKTRFKYVYDIIINILLSLILIIFEKNTYLYGINLFSIVLANNIVFMISRYNENIYKRTLQYLWILIGSIIILIIGFSILIIIK